MKKLFFFAVICAYFNAGSVWAQNMGDFGLGVILGQPTGITAKYWLNNRRAFDAAIGLSDDFSFHADYLWHGWKAFPQPKEGKLAAYLGLGGRFENEKKDDEVGIRTVAGIDFWFLHHPAELFFEIAPVIVLSPDTDMDVEGAIGFRYYFRGFN